MAISTVCSFGPGSLVLRSRAPRSFGFAIYEHLRLFGLLMHVGSPGKKSKTEAMYCPARNDEYEAGDTSGLVLDYGGTVSFTQSFDYLRSLLLRDLSDHHDVDARIR